VAYVELVICGRDDDGVCPWECLVKKINDPRQAVEIIQRCMEDNMQSVPEGKIVEARRESDHPDFVTYIAGKMGYM